MRPERVENGKLVFVKLTDEQLAVVSHPTGIHARVLAVAGSGKTTTMVHRIVHLTTKFQVPPKRIRVLMFNRLARVQFEEKIRELLPAGQKPLINTFHSFAYRFIEEMKRKGTLPRDLVYWLDEREELRRLTVLRVIDELEKKGQIALDHDPAQALEAIDLWKGSLIPPEHAGHRTSEDFVRIYAEYERLRAEAHAMAYEDFIPMAVNLIERGVGPAGKWRASASHLIVDEYQDINYSQQRLIELLAGDRADVMVVGDDDQTIYEWRGARPNYILREFENIFDQKPHRHYQLSHSFRFGPKLAGYAHSIIHRNTQRVKKPLVAHWIEKSAFVNVITSEQDTFESNRCIADEILDLVGSKSAKPGDIIVLGRMYAQLAGLQIEFLGRKVPFRIKGQRPFFERPEVLALIHYVQLALGFDQAFTQSEGQWLLSIANKPSRKLPRRSLEACIKHGIRQKLTVRGMFDHMIERETSPFFSSQRNELSELKFLLQSIRTRLSGKSLPQGAAFFSWLIEYLDYESYFDDYFGKGLDSIDRKMTVQSFILLAQISGCNPVEFLSYLNKLDPTQGAPKEQQIVMTTIHRTKGLEYDYVVIPDCLEGFLPCQYDSENEIYDISGTVKEPEPSESLEGERRLFYVALTRAKKGVLISTIKAQKKEEKLPSRFLEEALEEPNKAILGALTDLAQTDGNDKEALSQFLKAIEEYGGYKELIDILLTNYLPRIDMPALLSQVAQKARPIPPVPFSYNHTYPSSKRTSTTHAQPGGTLDPSWLRALMK